MPSSFTLRSLLGHDPRILGRRLLLCLLVGVVAGLGAVAFYYVLELGRYVFLDCLAGYYPSLPGYEKPVIAPPDGHAALPVHRWVLLFLPALGGLAAGFIIFSLAPEAEGHGTDAAIDAYHMKGGMVRGRVPIIKAITSALTIGSGGSGGREGPIAQIGSGFGSYVAQLLKLDPSERRTLMAAGMGAGIGAIFHAPLAGAIFAAEVMYRELDLEHEILVPTFIAAIVAYAVFGSIFGFHPLFITPNYPFDNALLLMPYLLLAVVCAVGAAIYVKAFYGVRNVILKGWKAIPNHFKPAIGGIFVGMIGFLLPEAIGTGYGVVQACFHEPGQTAFAGLDGLPSWPALAALLPQNWTPGMIALVLLSVIALAKIATTALAIGSGGSGGVFGPAVVIGGALGGGTGFLCQIMFPHLPVQPGAFALVGMAGFFAGAANTPISTIIMVSEMTGNYNLLVPSMLVCIVAYLLCGRFNLYEKQLASHLDAPSQLGTMATAVLRQLRVSDALATRGKEAPEGVSANLELRELIARYSRSTQGCLPVYDDDQRLVGTIDAGEIRRIVRETGLDDLLIASDIATPPISVTPADPLLTAIRRMLAGHVDEIVVVETGNPRKVIGLISRADVVATYERSIRVGDGRR